VWPIADKPCGLSVMASCNLLVTCRGERNKLVELSSKSGLSVREIVLQPDIVDPWHSVQLITGHFAVCHGSMLSDLQRVCMVDSDGEVARSLR